MRLNLTESWNLKTLVHINSKLSPRHFEVDG